MENSQNHLSAAATPIPKIVSSVLQEASTVDVTSHPATINNITTNRIGSYQNLSILDAFFHPNDSQNKEGSAFPQTRLIAVAAAVISVSFFVAVCIWACFRLRNQHRAEALSLPHTSRPTTHIDLSSPEKSVPSTKADFIGSPSSGFGTNTPTTSTFCEEFDFVPAVVPVIHSPTTIMHHGDISPCTKGAYGSPLIRAGSQLDRIPSRPDYLNFVPRVLLTGNLLPPQAVAVSDSKLLHFNVSHGVAMKTLPEPAPCKMSPAEASTELEKLIQQVNLRIFEDFDADDSFTESDSSSIPEGLSGLTGDSLPFGGAQRLMQPQLLLPLPLPLPRYNYRKLTPLRQSPSIV
ncbi:hypothetical protein PGTUg99_019485 [Puccinia graminis f. sp. tritici]|uniref:Uncharacterized protein n=1 Tax=Puccinia graminis f. sp. tritici TaxID=56615 RepID=A0A5B0RSZ9_PUCGR|nr:hypothetical protein PGTUg99_019485 [Puccinia graminis f. sp. tritici]